LSPLLSLYPPPYPPPSPLSLYIVHRSDPTRCPAFTYSHCRCMSAVSDHLLYYVRSLWSSHVLCLQSLVISCTMSAVSGHLMYYVCSLWSSPVLCPQSMVISCTMSAVYG
ncbi:unnamed protein product, partial [Staurois parvus]